MNLLKASIFFLCLAYGSSAIGGGLFGPTVFQKRFQFPANITVLITRKKFNPSKHKLDAKQYLIDGKHPFGADSPDWPDDEIDRFEVVFDGTSVNIPRAVYSDCYSVMLAPHGVKGAKASYGDIEVVADESGKSVMIIMSSCQCAADAYTVCWLISKNGDHRRVLEDDGS